MFNQSQDHNVSIDHPPSPSANTSVYNPSSPAFNSLPPTVQDPYDKSVTSNSRSNQDNILSPFNLAAHATRAMGPHPLNPPPETPAMNKAGQSPLHSPTPPAFAESRLMATVRDAHQEDWSESPRFESRPTSYSELSAHHTQNPSPAVTSTSTYIGSTHELSQYSQSQEVEQTSFSSQSVSLDDQPQSNHSTFSRSHSPVQSLNRLGPNDFAQSSTSPAISDSTTHTDVHEESSVMPLSQASTEDHHANTSENMESRPPVLTHLLNPTQTSQQAFQIQSSTSTRSQITTTQTTTTCVDTVIGVSEQAENETHLRPIIGGCELSEDEQCAVLQPIPKPLSSAHSQASDLARTTQASTLTGNEAANTDWNPFTPAPLDKEQIQSKTDVSIQSHSEDDEPVSGLSFREGGQSDTGMPGLKPSFAQSGSSAQLVETTHTSTSTGHQTTSNHWNLFASATSVKDQTDLKTDLVCENPFVDKRASSCGSPEDEQPDSKKSETSSPNSARSQTSVHHPQKTEGVTSDRTQSASGHWDPFASATLTKTHTKSTTDVGRNECSDDDKPHSRGSSVDGQPDNEKSAFKLPSAQSQKLQHSTEESEEATLTRTQTTSAGCNPFASATVITEQTKSKPDAGRYNHPDDHQADSSHESLQDTQAGSGNEKSDSKPPSSTTSQSSGQQANKPDSATSTGLRSTAARWNPFTSAIVNQEQAKSMTDDSCEEQSESALSERSQSAPTPSRIPSHEAQQAQSSTLISNCNSSTKEPFESNQNFSRSPSPAPLEPIAKATPQSPLSTLTGSPVLKSRPDSMAISARHKGQSLSMFASQPDLPNTTRSNSVGSNSKPSLLSLLQPLGNKIKTKSEPSSPTGSDAASSHPASSSKLREMIKPEAFLHSPIDLIFAQRQLTGDPDHTTDNDKFMPRADLPPLAAQESPPPSASNPSTPLRTHLLTPSHIDSSQTPLAHVDQTPHQILDTSPSSDGSILKSSDVNHADLVVSIPSSPALEIGSESIEDADAGLRQTDFLASDRIASRQPSAESLCPGLLSMVQARRLSKQSGDSLAGHMSRKPSVDSLSVLSHKTSHEAILEPCLVDGIKSKQLAIPSPVTNLSVVQEIAKSPEAVPVPESTFEDQDRTSHPARSHLCDVPPSKTSQPSQSVIENPSSDVQHEITVASATQAIEVEDSVAVAVLSKISPSDFPPNTVRHHTEGSVLQVDEKAIASSSLSQLLADSNEDVNECVETSTAHPLGLSQDMTAEHSASEHISAQSDDADAVPLSSSTSPAAPTETIFAPPMQVQAGSETITSATKSSTTHVASTEVTSLSQSQTINHSMTSHDYINAAFLKDHEIRQDLAIDRDSALEQASPMTEICEVTEAEPMAKAPPTSEPLIITMAGGGTDGLESRPTEGSSTDQAEAPPVVINETSAAEAETSTSEDLPVKEATNISVFRAEPHVEEHSTRENDADVPIQPSQQDSSEQGPAQEDTATVLASNESLQAAEGHVSFESSTDESVEMASAITEQASSAHQEISSTITSETLGAAYAGSEHENVATESQERIATSHSENIIFAPETPLAEEDTATAEKTTTTEQVTTEEDSATEEQTPTYENTTTQEQSLYEQHTVTEEQAPKADVSAAEASLAGAEAVHAEQTATEESNVTAAVERFTSTEELTAQQQTATEEMAVISKPTGPVEQTVTQEPSMSQETSPMISETVEAADAGSANQPDAASEELQAHNAFSREETAPFEEETTMEEKIMSNEHRTTEGYITTEARSTIEEHTLTQEKTATYQHTVTEEQATEGVVSAPDASHAERETLHGEQSATEEQAVTVVDQSTSTEEFRMAEQQTATEELVVTSDQTASVEQTVAEGPGMSQEASQTDAGSQDQPVAASEEAQVHIITSQEQSNASVQDTALAEEENATEEKTMTSEQLMTEQHLVAEERSTTEERTSTQEQTAIEQHTMTEEQAHEAVASAPEASHAEKETLHAHQTATEEQVATVVEQSTLIEDLSMAEQLTATEELALTSEQTVLVEQTATEGQAVHADEGRAQIDTSQTSVQSGPDLVTGDDQADPSQPQTEHSAEDPEATKKLSTEETSDAPEAAIHAQDPSLPQEAASSTEETHLPESVAEPTPADVPEVPSAGNEASEAAIDKPQSVSSVDHPVEQVETTAEPTASQPDEMLTLAPAPILNEQASSQVVEALPEPAIIEHAIEANSDDPAAIENAKFQEPLLEETVVAKETPGEDVITQPEPAELAKDHQVVGTALPAAAVDASPPDNEDSEVPEAQLGPVSAVDQSVTTMDERVEHTASQAETTVLAEGPAPTENRALEADIPEEPPATQPQVDCPPANAEHAPSLASDERETAVVRPHQELFVEGAVSGAEDPLMIVAGQSKAADLKSEPIASQHAISQDSAGQLEADNSQSSIQSPHAVTEKASAVSNEGPLVNSLQPEVESSPAEPVLTAQNEIEQTTDQPEAVAPASRLLIAEGLIEHTDKVSVQLDSSQPAAESAPVAVNEAPAAMTEEQRAAELQLALKSSAQAGAAELMARTAKSKLKAVALSAQPNTEGISTTTSKTDISTNVRSTSASNPSFANLLRSWGNRVETKPAASTVTVGKTSPAAMSEASEAAVNQSQPEPSADQPTQQPEAPSPPTSSHSDEAAKSAQGPVPSDEASSPTSKDPIQVDTADLSTVSQPALAEQSIEAECADHVPPQNEKPHAAAPQDTVVVAEPMGHDITQPETAELVQESVLTSPTVSEADQRQVQKGSHLTPTALPDAATEPSFPTKEDSETLEAQLRPVSTVDEGAMAAEEPLEHIAGQPKATAPAEESASCENSAPEDDVHPVQPDTQLLADSSPAIAQNPLSLPEEDTEVAALETQPELPDATPVPGTETPQAIVPSQLQAPADASEPGSCEEAHSEVSEGQVEADSRQLSASSPPAVVGVPPASNGDRQAADVQPAVESSPEEPAVGLENNMGQKTDQPDSVARAPRLWGAEESIKETNITQVQIESPQPPVEPTVETVEETPAPIGEEQQDAELHLAMQASRQGVAAEILARAAESKSDAGASSEPRKAKATSVKTSKQGLLAGIRSNSVVKSSLAKSLRSWGKRGETKTQSSTTTVTESTTTVTESTTTVTETSSSRRGLVTSSSQKKGSATTKSHTDQEDEKLVPQSDSPSPSAAEVAVTVNSSLEQSADLPDAAAPQDTVLNDGAASEAASEPAPHDGEPPVGSRLQFAETSSTRIEDEQTAIIRLTSESLPVEPVFEAAPVATPAAPGSAATTNETSESDKAELAPRAVEEPATSSVDPNNGVNTLARSDPSSKNPATITSESADPTASLPVPTVSLPDAAARDQDPEFSAKQRAENKEDANLEIANSSIESAPEVSEEDPVPVGDECDPAETRPQLEPPVEGTIAAAPETHGQAVSMSQTAASEEMPAPAPESASDDDQRKLDFESLQHPVESVLVDVGAAVEHAEAMVEPDSLELPLGPAPAAVEEAPVALYENCNPSNAQAQPEPSELEPSVSPEQSVEPAISRSDPTSQDQEPEAVEEKTEASSHQHNEPGSSQHLVESPPEPPVSSAPNVVDESLIQSQCDSIKHTPTKPTYYSSLSSFLSTPSPSSISIPKPTIDPATMAQKCPTSPVVTNVMREIILPARMKKMSVISVESRTNYASPECACGHASPAHLKLSQDGFNQDCHTPPHPPVTPEGTAEDSHGSDSTETNLGTTPSAIVQSASPVLAPTATPCEVTSPVRGISLRHISPSSPGPTPRADEVVDRTASMRNPVSRLKKRPELKPLALVDHGPQPRTKRGQSTHRHLKPPHSAPSVHHPVPQSTSTRDCELREVDSFAIIERTNSMSRSPTIDRYVNPTLSLRLTTSVKGILHKGHSRGTLAGKASLPVIESLAAKVEKKPASMSEEPEIRGTSTGKQSPPGLPAAGSSGTSGAGDNNITRNSQMSDESKYSMLTSPVSDNETGRRMRIRRKIAVAAASLAEKIFKSDPSSPTS